jgi:uncharacterized protein
MFGGGLMPKGISVYLGLNYTLQNNLDYIQFAREHGFTKIFTSLHIPEAEYGQVISEFKTMVDYASKMNMDVIADISPRTFRYLNCDLNNLKPLKEFGLSGIRVDFGFSAKEIAEFSRNPYGMKIEINASTVTENFLSEFAVERPDYRNIQACHNYYPRLHTGISKTTLENKNELLRKYGIHPITAFIPSLTKRRGPLFEGLPTLEIHRNMESQIAAKHLLALGVDDVLFGDSIPLPEEIESVGRLDEKVIELRVLLFKPNEMERKILFAGIHQNRPDCAEDVVRSTSSREWLKDPSTINPHDNLGRNIGSITIDNLNYLRYCGELQICKKELPADPRVNVVGKIIDEEIYLIDDIKDEVSFKFKEWDQVKL